MGNMTPEDIEIAQGALRKHDERVTAADSLAQYERLRASSDVTLWAKEWVANAALILARTNNDSLALLDEGWMIGWFANYAQTVNDLAHQQRAAKGVHPGTWHAFLHFYYMDCANAAMHTGTPRFSPITFRLAEFIMAEHGVQFAITPDERLSQVFGSRGAYKEDRGREAEDSLETS
jgi:hypothetical protein